MPNVKAYTATKNVLVAYLMAGMLLLACSSGPDLIPPNPPSPGPGPILELTDEQRIAVLNECGAFADALGDLKSDATQQTLVTYLKSRGEFEDAGATDGNVWAYFHDGRLAMFIPDWLDKDSDIGGRLPAPDVSGGRDNRETNMRAGVPEGKKVMLFDALGSAYQENSPYLTEIFSRSHTQYRVESKDATVENLKNADDVDIFHIDTHGGSAPIRSIDSRTTVFALWTSDSLTYEREVLHKPDLDATVLAYAFALDDRLTDNIYAHEWHYAFTGLFVAKYMSFTENSILYMDACGSSSEDASTFKQLTMGKAKNNTTTYIGWTGLSDQGTGFPTSRFIFDRLLGAPVYMLEAPPQRPFDLDPIFVALLKYNLGVSRYGGRLDYESIGNLDIILAPSIKYITMDDYNSVMTIEGLFGDNSRNDGKVTVGGITVPISTWTPNTITCELPVTGPGSSGDVLVIVNDHESNVVPLSEWTIPLHLVQDDFGVKVDAHVNLKIRADVHKYRSKPEETPKTDRPDMPMPLPGSLGFPCSVASSGTYTVGGQRTATCVKNGCTMRDTESAVARQGTLPFTVTMPGLGYGAYYKWSTDMKKIEVNVIVNIPDTGIETEAYTFCENGDPVTTSYSVATTLGIVTSGAPGLPTLEFHLDENYNIVSGDIHGMRNLPWGRCEAQGYFKHSATWPQVTPKSAPKPNTEARYAPGN
jgi:hypothetical protein